MVTESSSSSKLSISPLAPKRFDKMPAIAGIRLGVATSGQRYSNRDDLLLATFDAGTTVAAVMTRSNIVGAPIAYNRARSGRGTARALLVNAGNANVLAGPEGTSALPLLASKVGGYMNASPDDVYFASTGVIGEKFDPTPIESALPQAWDDLRSDNYRRAAHAIMTTDTYAKFASTSFLVSGRKVTINGIAKGSGMIAPNMATMLCFLFCDMALSPSEADAVLRTAVASSFNNITVDGDTSTSDTVMLFCAGGHTHKEHPSLVSDAARSQFQSGLNSLCYRLSDMVVRDGEGASKLVIVRVSGAASAADANKAAHTVANSPLVKTAIAGGDPNWGRIAMAVGRSGAKVNTERWGISLCGTPVLVNGQTADDFDTAAELISKVGAEVEIDIDLSVGQYGTTVRTCDLTENYIRINANYRS